MRPQSSLAQALKDAAAVLSTSPSPRLILTYDMDTGAWSYFDQNQAIEVYSHFQSPTHLAVLRLTPPAVDMALRTDPFPTFEAHLTEYVQSAVPNPRDLSLAHFIRVELPNPNPTTTT